MLKSKCERLWILYKYPNWFLLYLIMILTIFWCKLYRRWILFMPSFFFYFKSIVTLLKDLIFFSNLFVKIHTKRRLEGSIVVLEGGFEGWILGITSQCVGISIFAFISIYYWWSIVQVWLVKWSLLSDIWYLLV